MNVDPLTMSSRPTIRSSDAACGFTSAHPSTPPTPGVERDAIRAGCLRWLGGQRTESAGWDAFAAVDGQPLRNRLGAAADWVVVHHWFQCLVNELQARDAAGWSTRQVSLDHVWITDDEDAVILPFPVASPVAAGGGDQLLQQVAASVLAADERTLTRQTWPLRSRAVLSTIASPATTVAATSAALQTASDRAESFSSRKRAWLWAGTLGPTLLLGAFVGGVISIALIRDPDAMHLAPLIDYLRDPKTLKNGTRDAVAVYVAGHFRQRITDRKRLPRAGFGITERDWTIADSVVAAHSVITPEQLAAADRLVDGKWHGIPPGQRRPMNMLMIVVPIVAFGFAALAGLLTALFVRRGIVLRLLGLEIVTTRGAPAGRLRLFVRQMMIWSGPAAAAIAVVVISAGTTKPIPLAVAVLGVLTPFGFLIGLKTPERGLAERLSGTIVVPE